MGLMIHALIIGLGLPFGSSPGSLRSGSSKVTKRRWFEPDMSFSLMVPWSVLFRFRAGPCPES
ncbi:hypothetical protein Q671_16130 [Halomonas sp. PBN3]|nr:hypothetical protein Q671_16130 [Halomonas sp. PBN3]